MIKDSMTQRLRYYCAWVLVPGLILCACPAYERIAVAAEDAPIAYRLDAARRALREGTYPTALRQATSVTEDMMAVGHQRYEAQLIQGAALVYLQQLEEAQQTLGPLTAATDSVVLHTAARFYLAEAAYLEGAYPAAITAYQSVLASTDTTYAREAQQGLGWSYYQEGACEQSTASFAASVDSIRELSAAMLFAMGDCAQRQQQLDRAVKIYAALLEQHARDPWADEALLAWVDILVSRQDAAGAQVLIDRAIREYPASGLLPGFRLYRAQIRFADQQHAQAMEDFSIIIDAHQQSPYYVAALVGRGDIAFETAAYDRASQDYQRAIASAPHGPYAAYAMCQYGHALFNQQHWSQARQVYEQLVHTFPESDWSMEARYYAGHSAAAAGDAAQALQRYQRIIAAQPTSPWAAPAHIAWADLLMQQERWEEAQTIYRDIITTYPEASLIAAQATLRQALCASLLGDVQMAEQTLQEVLTRTALPTVQAEAHLVLARLAINRGHWDMGQQHLQAVEALEPTGDVYQEYLFWSGWIAMQRTAWSQALQMWDALHRESSGTYRDVQAHPWRLIAIIHAKGIEPAMRLLRVLADELSLEVLRDVVDTAGAALDDAGYLQAAAQVYAFITREVPADQRATYQYAQGRLYEQLHESDKAVVMYRRAMQSDAGHVLAARSGLAAGRLLETLERRVAAAELYQMVVRMPSQESRVAQERLDALMAEADE